MTSPKHNRGVLLTMCAAALLFTQMACTHRDTVTKDDRNNVALDLRAMHGQILDSLQIILPPVAGALLMPSPPALPPSAATPRLNPCTLQAIRRVDLNFADTSQAFTHWGEQTACRHPPSEKQPLYHFPRFLIIMIGLLAIAMATPALIGLIKHLQKWFKL